MSAGVISAALVWAGICARMSAGAANVIRPATHNTRTTAHRFAVFILSSTEFREGHGFSRAE
jgi:hypothetical protein